MGNKPKYRIIYEELSEKIRSGLLKPGCKLMTEKELSEQYQVSRITSKNAMTLLEHDGLIVRKQGSGSFVADRRSSFEDRETDIQAKKAVDEETDGGNSVCPDRISEESQPLTIGVLFDTFDYAFGCRILKGIEAACSQRNIYMYFRCTDSNMELERKYINDFIDHGVDGLIVMCVHNDIYDERILRLTLDDFPIILIDRDMANVNIPCVASDNYKAAKELARKVLDRGHQYVSIVSYADENTSTIQNRIHGVQDALQEKKILYNPELNVMGIRNYSQVNIMSDIQWKEGEKAICEFMSSHPEITAYLAVQCISGILTMEAARSLGKKDDVEVVFFDGPEGNYYPKPYYARVIQDELSMGEEAVIRLLARIYGENVEKNIVVPYEIVTREESFR